MPLTAGTRLGAYEILTPLGAGGMGEVYRARDAKLNRDVAIKLLPAVFAADRDRLARFEREAQTLAALNHPNIAQIFGVIEEPPGLVMELVEGEDLAARIARGRIPLDEVLPTARQIADALEAAHDQGIVHRDLKPANVKVRPDGTVKVLDFGLAKASAGSDGPAFGGANDPVNSPTFTAAATGLGMIVGTAAYMAPEQARGKAVDRRADIWAFGALLFEMLSGRRAFDGDSLSDVLASVLKSEPSWIAIPAGTPAPITRLLRRCLEKDPRKRLSAIGDARFDLVAQGDEPAGDPVRAPRRLLPYLAAVLAGMLVAGAAAAFLWSTKGPRVTPAVRRLSLLPPPDSALYPDSSVVALSPDSTKVAFIVGDANRSGTQLWVRPLDSLEARKLEGTEGATLPFWSPDGRAIGFFTSTHLMTVPVDGGRPQAIADIDGGRGGTWNAANIIVFAPSPSGPLFRVSATGGQAVQVTSFDAGRKQSGHRFPTFLPDGDHFLYAALPDRSGHFDIFVASLSGGASSLVGSLDNSPIYSDGHLIYQQQGVLVARTFDLRTLTMTGDPVPLGDRPDAILDPATAYTAARMVSAGGDGSLAYYSAPSRNTVADWYDASGRSSGRLSLPTGHYDAIRISPDGTQAIAVRSQSASEASLWHLDLVHGGAVLLSSAPGRADHPVWSPDGSKIVFSSDRAGRVDFYVKTLGDASPEQLLFRSPIDFKGPASWSPDGKWIVVTQVDPRGAQNVWLLPTGGATEMTPLVTGPTRDVGGPVSPDGRWLAYASDETGRLQLYVTPFPGGGRHIQVSREGASMAGWSPDGRVLRIVGDDGRTIWRVDVTPGATFSAGTPVRVGQLPAGIVALDMTSDGRFLAMVPEQTGSGSITVVQHWPAALAR